MVNGRSERKEKTIKTGEDSTVVIGKFALLDRPIMSQLTVTINNLILTYGSNSIIPQFKAALFNPENISIYNTGFIVRNVILYYGINSCKQYFAIIYGWKYE